MPRFTARFYFLLLFVAALDMQAQFPNTQRAVLDLRSWNPEQKNILTLNGPWEFYYNKLLSPADFNSSTAMPLPDTLVKPSSWGNIKLRGKFIGNTGYATYRLTLLHLPEQELTLDAYSMLSSYRVFVNGRLALEVGKPGTGKQSTVPMSRDAQMRIPAGADTVQLLVQAANFHHRKGGFVHPFELGTDEAIGRQRLMYYILDFTEAAALAIIGMFLLAMYIFRRKDFSVLYFSLFCISLSFRPVISVNYLLATLFPGISWSFMLRMEYFAVLFPCLFMLLFIKKLFPRQLPSLIVKIIAAIMIIKILITLFSPPIIFSWLVPPLLFIIPAGVLIFAITIVRAMIAKEEGAYYAGAGLLILLASLLLKVMVYANVLPPVHVLITVLDIAFIYMMSLILGSRFSLQFTKVERLQVKTELQTREIERQKREVEHQKEILEEKNKNIIDSINYARRIQNLLLPTEKYITRKLREMRRG